MFNQKPDLAISIPSKTQLLKMVVELTKHFVTLHHFKPSCTQQIALAVDEAITNVIEHSYGFKKDKEIRLEYYISTEGLKIKIVFSGIPPAFDTEDLNLGAMIKKKRKGGLGVKLIKKIMDSVEYRTENGTNVCEMIKWKSKN